jgi:radical SAM superfamily enzyme YgiQ (UPF0313 family)
MMRVLLISANTELINMPVLPLGLACVAAATERAGHEVKLLNLMMAGNCEASVRAALVRFFPHIIGVSVRNIDDQAMSKPRFLLDAVRDVISECRNVSAAPIVLGGAGYSMFPHSVLAYLGADMGIQGEGESAFVTLLERIGRQGDVAGIPGLILPGAKKSERPRAMKNLDRLQLPPPHLLGFTGDFEEIWLPFQTRRGCPMGCSYCSTATIEGKIIRKRDPQMVVESMAQFVDAGFHRFFFVDNTFNLPPAYAKELCTRVTAADLKISWRAILYPWKMDEKLIALMAEAGCREVSLGFESGSKEVLRVMNKRFDPQEVCRVAKSLKRHGIRCMGFLLLGGPGETEDTVKESLEFADSLDLESMKVTVGIRIYPHTRLAQIALREGIIDKGDDLLLPKFYINETIEERIRKTVAAHMAKRPHWHT